MSLGPDLARRRAWVLGLWLAGVLLALWWVATARYTADLSAFLPRSPDARQQLLITQLQSGLPSRTLLIGIEGGDAPARAAASRELAAALRASGLFDQVLNGERAAFEAVGRWLFEHRYALSPAVAPERFSAVGLREALAESLSLVGTPGGSALAELLPRDPSGEMQRIAEAMIPAEAPRLEGGVWVSRSAPRAVLMAAVRADGADLDAHERAITLVREAFAPAAARGLSLQLSGAPVFGVQSRALIEGEVRWLAIAGTGLMAALLLAAFASPRALAAALLPVGSGVLAGIAAVALGFGQVHGMTLGFGATLIGEAVDYAIYYLVQARRGAASPGSAHAGRAAAPGWRHWLATGWPTVRLGLLTSICGFAALVFSGFPGLAQLGVFSIAGLVGAALVTRFVLPLVLPDGAPGAGLRHHLGHAAAWALRGLPRLRWPVLALGAAAVLVAAQRADLWRADLSALSPLPAQALALDAALRADLGGSDARTIVVVQGSEVESTLQRAEAAAARLEALVAEGRLAGFDSVTRFLPSLATQQRRRASLPEPAALSAALAEATRGTPVSAARLAPFLEEVERARAAPPLTLQAVRASAARPLVDALLLTPAATPGPGAAAAPGPATALLPLQALRDTPGLDAPALRAALHGLAGVQVLDVKVELDDLYQRYLREAMWQAGLGAAAVAVLMALWLRNVRRLLAVLLPLVLAVALVLGGFAAAGATLGILHLVGLLLVVAVGSNYALFFDQLNGARPAAPPGSATGVGHPGSAAGAAPTATAASSPHTQLSTAASTPDPETLASLLLANLTTVASFGLLAWSEIPALAAIGRVVAPGALLALVLAAVFAGRRAAPGGRGSAGGAGGAGGADDQSPMKPV
jgi:predicted exporter